MTLDDVRASTAAVLTVTHVARLLTDLDGEHLDERTVRRACEDGQLPCIRVGRRLLIPRLPLLALLSAGPDMSEAGPVSPATATTEPREGARLHGDTPTLRSA